MQNKQKIVVTAKIIACLQLLYLCQVLLQDKVNFLGRTEVDLYPPHLQVVDIKHFQFIINNNICNSSAISLVTMVSSGVRHKEARQAIRESWGRPDIPDVNSRLVFLLGETDSAEEQQMLERENVEHGDIVQGTFLDTYYNLTYKNIMGKLWVSEFCSQTEFVIKADDDVYIDLYAVFALTRRYQDSDDYRAGSLLLGPVNYAAPVQRSGKWGVSTKEIPEAIYPEFCMSAFYIFNPATARRIVNIAKTTKYFRLDDVFVTGYLRAKLNITMVDTREYQMLDHEKFLRRKAALKPNLYLEDYTNTLLTRDANQKKMYLAMEEQARWCYREQCRTNIYTTNYQPEEWEKMTVDIVKNSGA